MTLMDTEPAPTAAGACDEPTAVPVPADLTVVMPDDAARTEAAEWAWSIEDETEEIKDDGSWHEAWAGASAILFGMAVVAVTVAGVGWFTLRHHDTPHAAPVSPPPATVTAPPVTTMPPPVTVTQTPTAAPSPTWTPPPEPSSPPPTKAAAPPIIDKDQGFLQALHNDGIIPASPYWAVSDAHAICNRFRGGDSRSDIITAVKQVSPKMNYAGAVNFVNDAAVFYCPQYTG